MDAPAGWYPDPLGRYEHRYWDGAQWTDHAAAGGRTIADPLDGTGPDPDRGAHPYADVDTVDRDPWSAPAASGGTEGLAVVSLILSVLWIFGLGSIAGIVTGVVARRRIRRSHGTKTGNGLAIAGIVVGILTLALTVLFVLALSLFAVWGGGSAGFTMAPLPSLLGS